LAQQRKRRFVFLFRHQSVSCLIVRIAFRKVKVICDLVNDEQKHHIRENGDVVVNAGELPNRGEVKIVHIVEDVTVLCVLADVIEVGEKGLEFFVKQGFGFAARE
jgi:hypothetical protein